MNSHKTELSLIIIITFISLGLILLYEHFTEHIGRSELWVLIIFFLVIVFLIFARNSLNLNSDPYELINPFLIMFTFYTMMLPINHLISSKYFDSTILFQYLLVALIGLMSFIMGYNSRLAKNLAAKLPVFKIENRELWIGAIILFLIGLVSLIINIAAFGGLKTYFTMGYGAKRYLISRQEGTIGYGWHWIGFSLFLFLIAAIKDKRRNFVIFIITCIICWIILSFWLGYRHPIVYLLIALFLAYNYLFRRLKLWPIILLAIGFYFIFVTYGYTRFLLPKYGVIRALSEISSFVFRRPDLILPVAVGEFNLASEAIIEILSSQSIHLKFGESYLAAFLQIIPGLGRIIPSEFANLGQWRMVTFYPGLYERGVGLGFHVLAEGLINFGICGVIIHMLLYGFFTKITYTYLIRDSKNVFVVIAYATTAPIILLDAIRVDFTTALFKWTHTYFGPIILVLIISHLISSVTDRMKDE